VLKDEFVKRSLEPTDLKLAGKVGLITAILAFDKSLGPDLRNELLVIVQGRLVKSARMSAIGRTAFSTSHDMRHSLSAIYANAEFLGSHDTRVPGLHTRQAKNESQDVHHNSDLLSFLHRPRSMPKRALFAESALAFYRRAGRQPRCGADAQTRVRRRPVRNLYSGGFGRTS
jgi:hypothetical protein